MLLPGCHTVPVLQTGGRGAVPIGAGDTLGVHVTGFVGVHVPAVEVPLGITAMLVSGNGAVISAARFRSGPPGFTATGDTAAVVVIKAVGLHKPRQGRVVRLVALGAGKGVLRVFAPALDRAVDAVRTLPGRRAYVFHAQRVLGMAAQAQTGKGLIVFLGKSAYAKGVAVQEEARERFIQGRIGAVVVV